METDKEVLDKQKSHWEKTLSENHEMFGEKPSRQPFDSDTELSSEMALKLI